MRGLALDLSVGAALRGARLATCAVRSDAALGHCLADGVLSASFHARRPQDAERIGRLISRAPRSRRSVLVLAAAAARHDACAALPRIAAPVLVLAGALDALVPPERQRRDYAGLSDVTFDIIPDAGHAIALEQPAAVAARILAFIAPA